MQHPAAEPFEPITVTSKAPSMSERVTHEPPASSSSGVAACGQPHASLRSVAQPGDSTCARPGCRDLRLRRRNYRARVATLAPLE